jgi:methylphosphotriester-DNA--protein-cysteine methyltransferase
MLDLNVAAFGEPREAWEARGLSTAQGSSLAAALATSLAASELSSCAGLDPLLKSATELARNFVGLERVAFYLREPRPGSLLLRGSWGTGAHGETTDEHGLSHELSAHDALALLNLRKTGACALYRPRAPWIAWQGDRSVVLGSGWVMVTPLFSGTELVGVMYNDAALTGSALEPSKQAAAAVIANFVSLEYTSRCSPVRWESMGALADPGGLVQRVQNALDQNLTKRGKELAAEFGVSEGHLSRAFKRGMGISLVEYRNRKRIDRFREAIQRRGQAQDLKQAVLEAGFGSYAQFHRTHKKFVGEGLWRQERRGSAAALGKAAPQHCPGPWPPAR